jgi:GNAT superfamily N-acetyltransferase
MTHSDITIKNLQIDDIEKIAHTFTSYISVEDNHKRWKQYLQEQQEGIRTACLLEKQNQFVGYGSLLRSSNYPRFKDQGIPEIHDVWVDEKRRGQGLAKILMAHLEDIAKHEGYDTIGLGMGLYKDYGPAQKLYFHLGYAPNGDGITYKYSPVIPGEQYLVDDDLIMWLTKSLN